jgi:tRNA U34 5-methylaminomethyl-2-thiouridine-forming methyltransferase MnmC
MENKYSHLYLTEDGSHSVLSDRFGVSYHSKHGAIAETRHVFIEAGLKQLYTEGVKEAAILEIGFGTGLNALMTLIEAEKLGMTIHFTTYEKYPLSIDTVLALNYPQILDTDSNPFLNMHTAQSGELVAISPHFLFRKHVQDFSKIDFQDQFQLIYFDAFAPESQPDLWSEPMMQKMFNALKTKGILTTYCAKGLLKRTLRGLGFIVQSLPGPPHKREMTRAIKP